MTIREEAIAAGVSEGTIKRRRRARREKREREHAMRSAAQKNSVACKNRLRDPVSGCLIREIGQPIYRARDPHTGRFYGLPKPNEPAPASPSAIRTPEPSEAEIAEVVARYPLRFTADDPRFSVDSARVLDVLARRMLALNTRDVLKAARESERLHTAMMLVSGGERLTVGAYPQRARTSNDPLARELYDGALTLILYDDGKTPTPSLLALSRDLVRARLKMGIE